MAEQKSINILATTILLSCVISSTQAAHILFLQQYATDSHIVVTWPLATALHALGHKVSYVSSTPGPDEINASSHPNISYFVPEGLGKELGETCKKDFGLQYRLAGGWNGGNSLPLFLISPRSNPILCEALLSSQDFQKWIRKAQQPENKVDLVVLDTNLDCGLGVAWALEAKVVSFQLFGTFMETLDALAGGGGSEMVSNILIPHNNPLSLLQRIKTTIASLVSHVATRRMWRQIEDIFRKHLAKEVPTIGEMVKNVSLVLSNGHFLEEHRRPLPPNFVSVPGIHVKETHSKLEQDVESFISKSETGFIYISLGTVVVMDELPQTIKSMFFNAMRKFPNIQFLWTWNVNAKLKPTQQELPRNLLIKNWFSQQDILGHPKILGFVTQAGRPSSQEALYNAVPLVTLPVLGDQDYNSYMLEDLGVSVNLEIAQLTTDKLVAAFQKLINKELKGRSVEVSKIMKDTPMKPIDKAVWWIEYALRHSTTVTSHLQPLSMDRLWAVKWHLDVWITIFGVTIALIYTLLTIFTKLTKLLSSSKKAKANPKKLKVK